ncbi:GIY-YIG nuclease superfamily protein [Vibrio thalassae]|uniref:GIY-YIG nuclease superfamily protein n=1 Tax=Vibrio thalassae TaxID=1243014 RepID=A0A240EP08_9VIBR|nr:GIY-YIG nuclease family protein [Vibrio thalassae]SNX49963.1 GIY-YIG nuclease superfamily protein [Vibrio thalassae]
MEELSTDTPWSVYLIRTAKSTLYCGITNDLQRRLKQHQQGKGAKALRGKGPLELVWSQTECSKSDALKTEIAIKKLNKKQKECLVEQATRFERK